ncbi:MAG: 16S rRNA (cytosine(967)-C(5))-methyltransferase RsmB [Geobacteraceae bacterium]|nr:16S rRNA (cytosine(967)-C(5))-methyltransferase RsmB [Geobacteraceae bacterium]
MSTTNPRRAAFDILLRIEKEHSYADILIDRELTGGLLKGPDRGLLTELVYGVLRQRGTLDQIINQFSKQRAEKLETAVLILLRLGLYQEFFLDRVPVSAAVNETVQLAHGLAPRAAGFINAVLRSADRERDAIRYPDRDADPAGFIAARHSSPRWLAAEWLDQLGLEGAEALARAMLATPPFTVRVNTLKTGRDELRARLAAEGVTAAEGRWSPFALHLSGSIQLATLASFREGLFTVQDESSQLAAILLGPQPGERVLDVCAAPGGKTTHMAQLMENRGAILACDAAPRKLALIEESAARLGIAIIETLPLNAARPLPAMEESRFDRILVDAPCSGLGVLRRNPEGKWWKSRQSIAELVPIQQAILKNAAGRLAEGGTLLYATCSTTREENEGVVDDFLSRRPDFVLEDLRELFPHYAELFTERGFFRSWPHRHGMDGFFAARLRRTNP